MFYQIRLVETLGRKNMKYQDVATYILYQQLFSEPNKIRDRRSTVKIVVEGSDIIMRKMLELILAYVEIWDQGYEDKYIMKLAEQTKLNPTTVLENFYERIKPMPEEQLTDKEFRFLLALSEVIKTIHEKASEKLVAMFEEKLGSEKKTQIESKFQILSEQNNLDFSLLLNLGILKEYAEIVGQPFKSKKFTGYFKNVLLLINA